MDYNKMYNSLEDKINHIIYTNLNKIIKIEQASYIKDVREATDTIITLSGNALALRIRDDKKYGRAYRDLTIRSYCNGHKTEIDKIKEGYANWYLYIWAEPDSNTITDWAFIDLSKIREKKILDFNYKTIMNKDGSTGFVAIPVSFLKAKGCVIGSSF